MQQGAGRRVSVQEVATRDGFQIEPGFVPTAAKIALIDKLSTTGLGRIEVTSFSSPRAIPALADAAAVMDGIRRARGTLYAVLVPNIRGCERALAHRPDELNFVMSASETHSQANLRMSRADSLAQLSGIIASAGGATPINVSISTAFGCPFEGEVKPGVIFALVGELVALGVGRVSLCDTTGVANPAQVNRLFRQARRNWPGLRFTAHFHNTRGMALANVLAALQAGIVDFDASLGGLGGCPFAPGATGNACTEDLVHMLQTMGYATGIDLAALLDAARDLPSLVGHAVPGQLISAGPSTRRYPAPSQP